MYVKGRMDRIDVTVNIDYIEKLYAENECPDLIYNHFS